MPDYNDPSTRAETHGTEFPSTASEPASTFPVTHAILSAAGLIDRILSKYRLRAPIVCVLLRAGVNDTYLVIAGGKRYYLRAYAHGWRSSDEVAAEISALGFLKRTTKFVSHALRARDGSYVTQVEAPEGTRCVALFTEAPGTAPDFHKLAVCRQLGEVIARFHAAMDRCSRDDRRIDLNLRHLIDDPLQRARPYLQARPDVYEYLCTIGNRLKECINLPTRAPAYGFCHGDCHPGNVRQDARGNLRLFDFDSCGYGWRAYDAAVFRWSLLHYSGFDKHRRRKAELRWRAFLDGYARVRPLTQEEICSTGAFVAIRQIWQTGSHIEYAKRTGIGFLMSPYLEQHIQFVRDAVEHLSTIKADRLR
jgi:Ser/Thr protein kinase RdoA (MazF antagonist)